MRLLILLIGVFIISVSFTSITKYSEQTKYNKKWCITYLYDVSNPADTVWKLKFKTEFDTLGRIIGESIYDAKAKDSIVASYTRKYDKNGNVILPHLSDIVKHYSNNGKNLKEEHFKSNGTLDYIQMIKYNDQHLEIENAMFNPDGTKENYRLSEYDDKGNVLKTIDSGMVSVGGLPMKKESANTYSRNYRYEKLDKAGNWTQSSFLMGDEYVLLTKRVIAY